MAELGNRAQVPIWYVMEIAIYAVVSLGKIPWNRRKSSVALWVMVWQRIRYCVGMITPRGLVRIYPGLISGRCVIIIRVLNLTAGVWKMPGMTRHRQVLQVRPRTVSALAVRPRLRCLRVLAQVAVKAVLRVPEKAEVKAVLPEKNLRVPKKAEAVKAETARTRSI